MDFWDHYWGRTGLLLANFSLSLLTAPTDPEVFAKVNSAQFPRFFFVFFFKVANFDATDHRTVPLIIQSQIVRKIERIVICRGAPNVDYSTVVFVFDFCIVSRGIWL